MQKGTIIHKGKSWLFRYWQLEAVNGQTVRVRKTEKLADYNDRYRTKKSVEPFAEDIRARINAGQVSQGVQTLQQMVENSYFPHIEAHNSPSTVKGYKQIFNLRIKARIAGVRLSEFRTVDGQRLLDNIAKDDPELGHQTLIHAKRFLSGVFSYAIRMGFRDTDNPMRYTKVPDGQPSQETYAYSLAEIETILDRLKGYRDDLTLVAGRIAAMVAAFVGLSLSELRGLRWTEVLEDRIVVVNTYWQNVERVKKTKTKARQNAVPLLDFVADALVDHHRMNPNSVYVFESPLFTPNRHPLDLESLATNRIAPALEGSGVEWHGWHAFRRGLATNLNELGVQEKTIQAILRHSHVEVTRDHYIKALDKTSVRALQRLGRKIRKSNLILDTNFGHQKRAVNS